MLRLLAAAAVVALAAGASAAGAQSRAGHPFLPLTQAQMMRYNLGPTCTFSVRNRAGASELLLWRPDTLYARTRVGLQRCRLPGDRGPNPTARFTCAGQRMTLRLAPQRDDESVRAWLTVEGRRRVTVVTGEWGCDA